MAEYEIYAQQLHCLGHGFALYEPDPAGKYDEVRVGDVGYVLYGNFHRLFNILHDEDDESVHRMGVPEGFEPLAAELRETYKRTPLPSGVMCSSTVRHAGGGVGAIAGCAAILQSHISFKAHNFPPAPSLKLAQTFSSPARNDRVLPFSSNISLSAKTPASRALFPAACSRITVPGYTLHAQG